jgi:hypothetical protein
VDNINQNNTNSNKITSIKPSPSATEDSVSITDNPMFLNDDDTIVVFDVGGRIFKVRRAVIESFPETVLARCSCDLWMNMLSTSGDHQKEKQNQKPIFLDRDFHRFSCFELHARKW